MVHLPTPAPDTGHFSTLEVTPKAIKGYARAKYGRSASRIIRLPRGHYREPPNLAAGFNSLDLSHERDFVRANLIASDFTTKEFKVEVETWGDSACSSAGATWIEHAADARDCFFGQFDSRDADPPPRKIARQPNGAGGGNSRRRSLHMHSSSPSSPSRSINGTDGVPQEYSKRIVFPQPFKETPTVICWLNRLDLAAGGERNFRVSATASNITPRGFVAHLDTWADSALHGGAMAWIAFPARKKRVAAGTVNTQDVRSWNTPRETCSKYYEFEPGAFTGKRGRRVSWQDGWRDDSTTDAETGSVTTTTTAPGGLGTEGTPTVLIALHSIDMAGNADLRVKAYVDEVSGQGFRWHLDTWGDSTLYSAGASWIALGFS